MLLEIRRNNTVFMSHSRVTFQEDNNIWKDSSFSLSNQVITCCRCVFAEASGYILKMNIFVCLLSVYSSDVIDRQCSFMDSGEADTKAVIILVPVRLGGERTNMDYLEFVKV